MGKRGKKMRAQVKYLRKALQKTLQHQSQSTPHPIISSETDSTDKNRKKPVFLFVLSISLFIAQNFWGAGMLTNLSPSLGYILFLSSNSIIFAWWTWLLATWIIKKRRFARFVKVVSVSVVVMVFVISSPLYTDYFINPRSTVTMPMWVNDSTNVTVHYGQRQNDFFWTDTSVGDLKRNKSVVLNVNGEEIFSVQADGRQIYVNAKLFAGYDNEIVPGYMAIGSPTEYSVEMKGYFDTSSPVTKSFWVKLRPTVTKYKSLAAPVEINTSGFKKVPNGWTIQQGSKGLEVKDDNNIPVLILEYKNPYEITIYGLFVTPLGILKVDNSKNVIFEIGDSPFELGTYTVDKALYPLSLFDIIKSERVYDLRKWEARP